MRRAGLGLLALTAAFVAMFLASCSHAPPIGPKIDPALITLMPPDTILAAGARVEDLVKTPMFQKYVANLPLPVVDQFAEQTGMDPRKSLWEVLLVSDGTHRVVLGRGRFGDQMEAKLEKSGGSRMEYKGMTLVGNDHLAVIFLNDTTAAVGDVASLHALIDGRSKSNGPPPAIAERLKDIPPNAQLWTVYTGPVNPASIGALVGGLPGAWQGNLANLNRLAAALQSVSVYFDFRTGLSGQLHGVYANEADARTVRDALKALLGFARLSAPTDPPDLLHVYDGIEITQAAGDVRIKAEEPQDLADKFLKQWTIR